jgi:hypothetical protein
VVANETINHRHNYTVGQGILVLYGYQLLIAVHITNIPDSKIDFTFHITYCSYNINVDIKDFNVSITNTIFPVEM